VKLRNVPIAAWNLAGVATRRVAHQVWELERALRRIGRHAARTTREYAGPAASIADLGTSTRRARIRLTRRAERFQEHVIGPLQEERQVLARIRDIGSSRGAMIVGPWVSEVGYEVLYWVPFLRWLQDRYAISPDRVIAVSRGGVAWWYSGIASRYIDVLDVRTPEEFAHRADARRSAGDQKQLDPSDWERGIIEDVQRRAGVRDAQVLHPGLMYRLFRNVWHGDRGLDFLFTHTAYGRHVPSPAADEDWLPPTFAAVKFYTGPALPDTPQTRMQLRAAVARLAGQMPVVSLDTGLGLDEHRDFLFDGIPGVLDLRNRMTPATNLAVQSRVLARASLYAGTCGSLAWLAPMLGVPTVAVYADDRYLSSHLYAARYAYRRMKAARFSVVDLQALARVA
jgi:hypothetical protein